jgi:16S rRNA pseudouridine516 synthase
MLAAVGNHVVTLHRSALGPLSLGDLPNGAWRELYATELSALQTVSALQREAASHRSP